MYYKGAAGVVLVYDVSDVNSFKRVKTWVSELQKFTPKDTPIIIAGNKCDLQNKAVSTEEAKAYAKEIGVP